jgi:hypothetical protein
MVISQVVLTSQRPRPCLGRSLKSFFKHCLVPLIEPPVDSILYTVYYNKCSYGESSVDMSAGCLYGTMRFAGVAEPVFQIKCHCTDCRKTTGSGRAALIGVPDDPVAFSGEVMEFSSLADSGREVTRAFCPACGSGVHSRSDAAAVLVFVRASALDDPDQFMPQMSIRTSSIAAWDVVARGIASFSETPV